MFAYEIDECNTTKSEYLHRDPGWARIIEEARGRPGEGYFDCREFQMSGFRYELADEFDVQFQDGDEPEE